MSKPLILVTNDDGITAPGIRNLIEAASEIGEVVVVAPDAPQSGKGHALTINAPLRPKKVKVFPGIEAFQVDGTPVDCVKLARHVLLKGRQIDLCVSGINHGSNASINILYSGTVSAAMEASLEGIDAIGFSLLDLSFEADFSAAKHYAGRIIRWMLDNPKPGGCHLLNVNVPNLPLAEIKGVRVCRQSDGRWKDEFQEGRTPSGQPYYWMTGKFVNEDRGEDTDDWALDNGFVSVVPSQHDLTDHRALSRVNRMEKELKN